MNESQHVKRCAIWRIMALLDQEVQLRLVAFKMQMKWKFSSSFSCTQCFCSSWGKYQGHGLTKTDGEITKGRKQRHLTCSLGALLTLPDLVVFELLFVPSQSLGEREREREEGVGREENTQGKGMTLSAGSPEHSFSVSWVAPCLTAAWISHWTLC